MQNVNNNRKLRIKQYVPPTSNTIAVGRLGSGGPSTNSTSVEDQKKATSSERGSFRNKPGKVLTLMKLFDKEYPPRAKKGKKQDRWNTIVRKLNEAFPNDKPIKEDACGR